MKFDVFTLKTLKGEYLKFVESAPCFIAPDVGYYVFVSVSGLIVSCYSFDVEKVGKDKVRIYRTGIYTRRGFRNKGFGKAAKKSGVELIKRVSKGKTFYFDVDVASNKGLKMYLYGLSLSPEKTVGCSFFFDHR